MKELWRNDSGKKSFLFFIIFIFLSFLNIFIEVLISLEFTAEGNTNAMRSILLEQKYLWRESERERDRKREKEQIVYGWGSDNVGVMKSV